MLAKCLPISLQDGTFKKLLEGDAGAETWLNQLLAAVRSA